MSLFQNKIVCTYYSVHSFYKFKALNDFKSNGNIRKKEINQKNFADNNMHLHCHSLTNFRKSYKI